MPPQCRAGCLRGLLQRRIYLGRDAGGKGIGHEPVSYTPLDVYKRQGGVLVTVRDTDKQEVVPIVEKYEKLGFKIYATAGTALTLNQNMIAANTIRKIEEEEPNSMTLFDENKIDYIITTSKKGRKPQRHSVQMRRRAVERSIVTMTALDTANALANSLMTNRSVNDIELVDITTI